MIKKKLILASLSFLLTSIICIYIFFKWHSSISISDNTQLKAIDSPISRLYCLSNNKNISFEHRRNVKIIFPETLTYEGMTKSWSVIINGNGLRQKKYAEYVKLIFWEIQLYLARGLMIMKRYRQN